MIHEDEETYGRQELVLSLINLDAPQRYIINSYQYNENVLVFKDFHDNDKIHIYPWSQVRHVTIGDNVKSWEDD